MSWPSNSHLLTVRCLARIRYMQNFCRFSTRWHQQFCQSANLAGHQKCMRILSRGYRQSTNRRPLRQVPAVSSPRQSEIERIDALSDLPQSDVVVREYEQYLGDKKTLKEVDPNDEVHFELAEVRAQMEKLEKELDIMRQGPFGPQTEFMQSLPEDERDQLLKALAEEGTLQGEEDLLTIADLERMEEEDEIEEMSRRRLGVSLRIPKKDQAYVRHFNRALRETQEPGATPQKSLALWTWYLRCQKQIHNFSNIVSDDVWKVLWETQTALKVRSRHVVMLAQDMLKTDEPLAPDQWIEYIKALHASGDTATAIEVWKSQRSMLRSYSSNGDTYWGLGVNFYAALGRPLKAQELALNAIEDGASESLILIPVIVAWAKSQGPDSMIKAWSCYLRLREKLGSSIKPHVFEDISNAFLSADCADMALNVFKDMLLSQEQSQHDSQAVYRQAVKHFDKALQNATTEENINRVGLSALLILPRSFQNKYFFASWIKKLIGEGRIDAALMVVELMCERGITPDAKPLNGIVGAWLRDGSTSAQRKAEKLAWSMIDARAELVRDQSVTETDNVFRKIVAPGDFGHARRAVFLRRRIPPATIETFSILLLHYTRRSDFAEAERLTHAMTRDCQIKPNSFIMNHWLYADLRASKIQQVWNRYKDLSRDIAPDLETFAALFDTAKAQYSRSNSAHADDFPTPRQLFSEMMTWTKSLSDRKLRRVLDDFSPELYTQVVRCFCLTADLPGALVAVHGLQQVYNVFPDVDSIRLICSSAARLLPQQSTGRSRGSKPRHKNILTQIVDIVESIEERTKTDLVREGADPRALSDPESELSQRLRLPVMTEFICMFLQQKQTATGSYQNDVKIAAKAMGVDMSEVDLSAPDSEDPAS